MKGSTRFLQKVRDTQDEFFENPRRSLKSSWYILVFSVLYQKMAQFFFFFFFKICGYMLQVVLLWLIPCYKCCWLLYLVGTKVLSFNSREVLKDKLTVTLQIMFTTFLRILRIYGWSDISLVMSCWTLLIVIVKNWWNGFVLANFIHHLKKFYRLKQWPFFYI